MRFRTRRQAAEWSQVEPVHLRMTPLWWRSDADPDLTVQAVHDGTTIAVRLAWHDVDQATSTPCAASRLKTPWPWNFIAATPSRSWAWAVRRRRSTCGSGTPTGKTGRQSPSKQSYPNMVVDEYPFSEKVVASAELTRPGARMADQPDVSLPARASGNQIVPTNGESGGSSLHVGGPGSVTFRIPQSQLVRAHGTWKDGRWTVVMSATLAVPVGRRRRVAGTGRTSVRRVRRLGWRRIATADGQKSITIWQDLELANNSQPRQSGESRSWTSHDVDSSKRCAAGGGMLLAAGPQAWAFQPVSVENPLGAYPDRDWEKIYLDQYRYDSTFTWVCAPNDTHMCRLRAFVRNGVMIRSEQNYDHDRYGDLYGNKATKAWNPRGCPKGYTMQRRDLRAVSAEGPGAAQGLEGVGRCRLSVALRPARAAHEVQVRRPRQRQLRAAVVGRSLRSTWPTALVAIAGTYSGDDGRGAAAEGRLRAADDRPGRRGRHAHDQDRLEPADSRRRRQVRHLSLRQSAGPARSPRPRRAAGKGPRRPRLERIHLARRPGAGPSVRARTADVRHGLQRPAVLASWSSRSART